MPDIARRRRFLLFLVKPSHYDEQGYVIQWWKSALPSNSLACLFGIAQKCMEDQVLGEDVDIEIFPVDETNTRVRPDRIARQIQDNGGFGMVGFVGVQSNQFPRVMEQPLPLEIHCPPLHLPLDTEMRAVCFGGSRAHKQKNPRLTGLIERRHAP
jgi:hypothetical protein